MKGRLFALIALAALLVPVSASAFETAGKFGLGYDADMNGLNMRYYFGRTGIDFTLGFGLQTKRADGEALKFDLIAAPKLVHAIELAKDVNLNVIGGLFVQVLGSNVKDTTDLNMGVFGGLAPEILLFDHLALEVFFGITANINNLLKKQAAKINFNVGTLGSRLSVVSGAVFRYYF